MSELFNWSGTPDQYCVSTDHYYPEYSDMNADLVGYKLPARTQPKEVARPPPAQKIHAPPEEPSNLLLIIFMFLVIVFICVCVDLATNAINAIATLLSEIRKLRTTP